MTHTASSTYDYFLAMIYLNSANLSLCPTEVMNAITFYQAEFEKNPTLGLKNAWSRLEEVQRSLAEFLGARPGDLFLRSNVTQVLNQFILGVPLPPESEILVGELEYGAIVNVVRQRNLPWRVLKLPTTLVATHRATSSTILENILSQLGPRTRMVLLSHVIGGTGMVLPIREIARELRRRDILFVVDGAYAPGALPIDFRDLEDVDFYGCSLYKWMMGPKGTAFGWVAPHRQDLLQPLQAGWTSLQENFQARLRLSGCHDFAPFFAIRDTLDFWQEHGADKIRDRMACLRQRLREGCRWPLLQSEDERLRGPLLAFRCAIPQETLVQKLLTEHEIQAHGMELQGMDYLVLSPHFYNTHDEIDRCLDILHSL